MLCLIFFLFSLQVVEALSLPAALRLVSACCGDDLRESDEEAVEVSESVSYSLLSQLLE